MYFLIGTSLLFGFFYAILLTFSVLSVAAWRVVRPRSSRWSGRRRSDVLCGLHIAPLAVAATVTLAFLFPAFLKYEPAVSSETIGIKLAIIAFISAGGLLAAFIRVFASWWRTRRLIRAWLRRASHDVVDGFELPAYRIEHDFPVLAVVGTFRPRVFVAEKVLGALEPAELRASIAHEFGHIAARDNLKRIAMRLCSDLLVFPFMSRIDRDWSEAAEAAADEAAAGQATALDLASALIKIGRLVPAGSNYKLPAGAYLLEPDDASLAGRIEALVNMSDHPVAASTRAFSNAFLYSILLMFLAVIASMSFNPAFLARVHETTEKVFAFLQ